MELDRPKKLPVYAREGVRHVWLVDAIARTFEVLSLEGETYVTHAFHNTPEPVRAVPFEALEISFIPSGWTTSEEARSSLRSPNVAQRRATCR
jgi:hypothetical protein